MTQEIIQETKERMEKALANLQEEFNTIRVGRANPHILDRIEVDYYGSMAPIQQVANVSVPEGRVLQIQPWDAHMLKAIEKAINMSEIGIHPTNDGKVIRLVFPEAKIAVRNIRRDSMDKVKKAKKDGDLTEDDQKDLEDKLQKQTDEYIKKVDQKVEAKQKEVMSV